MQFDIIDITQDEVDELPAVRQKLIRTAQQKKNELEHKLEQQLQAYYCLCNTNNMYLSSLYNDKKAELEAEVDYQVEILREQLLFNLELGEPTHDGETGGSGSEVKAWDTISPVALQKGSTSMPNATYSVSGWRLVKVWLFPSAFEIE